MASLFKSYYYLFACLCINNLLKCVYLFTTLLLSLKFEKYTLPDAKLMYNFSYFIWVWNMVSKFKGRHISSWSSHFEVSLPCFSLGKSIWAGFDRSEGFYIHRLAQLRKPRTTIHALRGIWTHDSNIQAAKIHSGDRAVVVVDSSQRHYVLFNIIQSMFRSGKVASSQQLTQLKFCLYFLSFPCMLHSHISISLILYFW